MSITWILATTLNDALQWSGVIIAMTLAILWIAKRIRRGASKSCDCGCSGCALKDNCQSPKKETKR